MDKFNESIEHSNNLCYNNVTVNENDCLEEKLPMTKQFLNEKRNNDGLITALYERLSRDDEVHGPSNSIINQKQLLEDYAAKNGFLNICHYTDDGISGTRFDRPGFMRLMDDIESGKVAKLLCKDTSRLGRDYIRVGLFMETLRQKKVRLISIGDNLDTDKGEDDFIPFRNIIHEWFARDISRKIKSAKRTKGMNGKYVSSFPPYGYKKSLTEKDVWEIDPEPAEVIRKIFNMTIAGNGITTIANTLTREKIHCPAYHHAKNGLGNFQNRELEDQFRWQPRTIDLILGRAEYKGCMVNLRTEKNFKDPKSKLIPKEDWYVFENAHEAIVSADTWAIANEIRGKIRRKKHPSLGEPHFLNGMLICATCGSKLNHMRGTNKKTGRVKNYFTCAKSKYGKDFCTDHRINGADIETLVRELLQSVCIYAMSNEKDFTSQINEIFSRQQVGNVKVQRKKLNTIKARYLELDKLIQRVYEDNVSGKINDKRFTVLSEQYENEQAELENIITTIETEINNYDDSTDKAEKFLQLTRRYKDFSEITPTMVHEFVDKIIVHERADKRAKITTQKVEICLNFIGTFVPDISDTELTIQQFKDSHPETEEEYEKHTKKLKYQREYAQRRRENGGERLGYFTGKKPDDRTLEQKESDEASKTKRLKKYHKLYYLNQCAKAMSFEIVSDETTEAVAFIMAIELLETA